MIHLSEYQRHPTALADFLPWAGLIAPGIVLNKDGCFQRSARFRGPDLDSAGEAELVAVAARVNNALKRLGSGWALFVEAERRVTAEYPDSEFPEALSWLVDQERRSAFEHGESHFESRYTLTLLYLPPDETRARAGRLLLESDDRTTIDWAERLDAFETETERFFGLLKDVMPELAWLSDGETLTYLHRTVSTAAHTVRVPEIPMYLDTLLTDTGFTGGLKPRLGDHHLRIITVRGFPTVTWPGLLDQINRLGFGYRWTSRFIFLDKLEAERELVKRRRQWFAKRKGIVTLLRETVFQQESPLVDSDAANKSADADAALQELGSDSVGFGYVTTTLVISDVDAGAVEEKRKALERVIQGRGFVALSETLNAVEAWLSSIPGQVYANVRQPLISTGNLAHLLPLSAVWAGPESNHHLKGPPLIVTRTDGSTPFRWVTHIGDVGHTLIVGPTGAGKSVLLATMLLQFRRYANSRLILFDQGGSARAAVLGLEGEYYELGASSAIAFQPLARIDEEAVRTWAADWVAGLLSHEKVTLTPEIKERIWSALQSLASAPRSERTLTGLSVLLQSNALRQALEPYTLSGPHGSLLDAEVDTLGDAAIQCFEMQSLMHSRSAALPVLLYLFHRLEARFDGSPTLLILDEAWAFLDDPVFAGRIREWLKMLRKKNVSVVFATQSLTDIQGSSIASALIESCPSRIFLPATQALEPQLRAIYEGFGLNDRQIRTIAHAAPKREYYYQSRLGNRLFELNLGPTALAFAGASRPEDQVAMDELLRTGAKADFARRWLRFKGLPWAADMIDTFKSRETS